MTADSKVKNLKQKQKWLPTRILKNLKLNDRRRESKKSETKTKMIADTNIKKSN
jgi:hypothetical protein